MSNFMGPMAPPQAAPSQPPQLDIRTNPNQRERFRDFMRQNTRPSMGMALPMAQPMMQPMAPTTMPMAPQAPRPPIPMAIRPTTPMMPQPMAAIDVFSPQYMNQPRPMMLEDGGSVPPRRTEIRGQDHMLSYITPDEADILKALGGSGEAGPMGIPSFPGGYGGEGMGGFGDAGVGNDSGGGPAGSGGTSGTGPDTGSDDGPDNDGKSGGGQDRSGMQSTLEAYQDMSPAEKAADFAKAAQIGKDIATQSAKNLVAKTFALDSKGNPIGAPNSKTGFATTGNPSQGQINDALEAAKSLGIDVSGSQTANDLGLNDPDTTAVEAVQGLQQSTLDPDIANLLGLNLSLAPSSMPAISTPTNIGMTVATPYGLMSVPSPNMSVPGYSSLSPTDQMAVQTALANPGVTDPTSVSSLSPAQTTESFASQLGLPDSLLDSPSTSTSSTSPSSAQANVDPMAVARAMDQISPKGIMDIGLVNSLANIASDLLGLTQDPEAVRSDYENRAYSSLGMSPGLASAVLGTQTATGPVTGAIGGPRGGIMGALFGGYSPGAAGMTGMTPDGKSTGAITGDQLADLATRNRSGLLGPISGFFNDLTLSAASKSNVAVVNPATGKIVGAIDGKGRYTGNPQFNPNTYGQPQGPQGDGPVYIPPVVQPPTVTDPGPDEPNVFGGIGDTTYEPLVQNFTGDGREQYAGTLRMPVGYGDPRTGYIAPQAFSTAGFAPPPRGPIPIGFFEDGGEVLNQAADNFLEALTAA